MVEENWEYLWSEMSRISNLNFHHGWRKFEFPYSKIGKIATKFPPWLEKKLNSFDQKWLTLDLKFHHAMVGRIFEFPCSEMANRKLNFWNG